MIGPHRLRQTLSAGKTAFGPLVNFDSAWFVDLSGLIGFDFVLIDCEHGPMTPQGVEGMIRAAEAAGVSPIVRIPANVPHEILRYLDLGAVGIKVPRVETAEDARNAVAAARYPPLGERGLALSTRAAGYGVGITPQRYAEIANREVFVIALVESAVGVDNVDAIAATDGIDLIALGPGDLSMSMGHGGDRKHPAVVDAMRHVMTRAKAHGKYCSLPANDPAAAAQCIEQGADLVFVGPGAWLVDAGRRFLADAVKSRA